MIEPIVGLAKCINARYPTLPPFSPSEIYPEFGFISAFASIGREQNCVYSTIRESMNLAGWDSENYGQTTWNPLRNFIRPGCRIVLKPNWVLHEHHPSTRNCLTTHGSVIRAVLDYAYLAGGPNCHITIADAPEQAADFNKISIQTGIPEIKAFYHDKLNFDVEVCDLRTVASDWDGRTGFFPPLLKLSGDPLGYLSINLGYESELEPITKSSTSFGIAQYSNKSLKERHKPGHHEYLVARTILEADTIINLPKMKTHQKSGLTGGLKNFVGINGCKDRLPHYREGSESQGGDEYNESNWLVSINRDVKNKLQRKNKFLWKFARTVWHSFKPVLKKENLLHSGAWRGNDTIWRMIIDLNKIVKYVDRNGSFRVQPQRQICCILDGVIAGQGDGPLSPIPKPTGIILASNDVVAIDMVIAQLMGFDWRKIPLLFNLGKYTDSHRISQFDHNGINVSTVNGELPFEELESMNFLPPPGWIGSIENSTYLNNSDHTQTIFSE